MHEQAAGEATIVALDIQVFFDFVCPWCAIGLRQLDAALHRLALERPDVRSNIAWHGFPLLPEIPRAGVSFTSFYRARLGGDAAVAARQAQLRSAARAVGMAIAFDRIDVMPNTLAAHRLARHIQRETGDARAFIEALFDAYFMRGEHIGASSVLARVAAACGIEEQHCAPALASSPEEDAVVLRECERARRRGVYSVPHLLLNGRSMAGVQGAGVLDRRLREALDVAG